MSLDTAPPTYPHAAQIAKKAGKPLWVFDLEATTGDLKDPFFGIVELGWVTINPDGTTSEGSFLIDAGKPMNPYAAKLTGITRKLYNGQPSLRDRWNEIESMMIGSICSGFGIHDLDCRALFFESSSFLGDAEGRRPRIDTLDARDLWISHSGSSKGQLSEVAEIFGHLDAAKHRALADAKASARALDGLAKAMGADACLSMRRLSWNPLEAADKARELAEKNEEILSEALAATAGCCDFNQGLATLNAMGARCHYSAKGFTWWAGNHRVKSKEAPSSPAFLAQHFKTDLPGRIDSLDTLERCQGFLSSPDGAGVDDDKAALLCLCRTEGSCAAARAKAIRSGSIPPWEGIDPSAKDYCLSLAPDGAERDVLDAFRAGAPQKLKGFQAWSACAASWVISRSPLPPKPATAKL